MQHPFSLAAVSVVTTTVASADEARQLARLALAQRLAACVQIEAIESHYVWQGQAQQSPEWRLQCKTTPDAVPHLVACLRQHHAYEVPELLLRGEQAQADYAQWVADAVQLPADAKK